jgi:hypothetical protein
VGRKKFFIRKTAEQILEEQFRIHHVALQHVLTQQEKLRYELRRSLRRRPQDQTVETAPKGAAPEVRFEDDPEDIYMATPTFDGDVTLTNVGTGTTELDEDAVAKLKDSKE